MKAMTVESAIQYISIGRNILCTAMVDFER
jgi:hypothetical protein